MHLPGTREGTFVIAGKVRPGAPDKGGFLAREAVLGRMLDAARTAEHGTHPPVQLAVVEERRGAA